MGVAADVPGRVAMVTNVRVGPPERAGVRSRGQLPAREQAVTLRRVLPQASRVVTPLE